MRSTNRKRRNKNKRGTLTIGISLLALAVFWGISVKENNSGGFWGIFLGEKVPNQKEQGSPGGENSSPDEFQVHILDVGQGLSVFIEAGDDTLLYDGGDRDASSFVLSYLQQEGVESLDYCIASHYDADHLAGIVAALNEFDIGTLIAPDYEYDTATYRSFQDAVADYNLTVHQPIVSELFTFGNGNFQILAPVGTGYEDENDYSVVIKVSIGDSALLLTGDATSVSEAEIIQTGADLDSDVLVLGHHGSYSSTGRDFYRAVSPEYAVISCAQNNDYGHPHTRIMNLLKESNIALYRTDLQGTVRFTMTAEDITFEREPCEDYATGDDVRYRNYSNK